MRTLEFNVDRQRLKKKSDCDFSGIVAGSVGYLKAKFHFSEEWNDCKKAASFWLNEQEHAVLLDSQDSCVIPEAVLAESEFKVSVIGIKDGYKISTNRAKVRQEVY